MKAKYIMAIGALGSALAIVPASIAASDGPPSPQIYPPAGASTIPASAVWDGSEYVGQADGKYYYLGPNDTWLPLDQTRQERFDEWQKNNANGNETRSQGTAKGLNASAQTSPVQTTNPNGQSSQIRNTRYEGHDLGQTRPFPPPLETH